MWHVQAPGEVILFQDPVSPPELSASHLPMCGGGANLSDMSCNLRESGHEVSVEPGMGAVLGGHLWARLGELGNPDILVQVWLLDSRTAWTSLGLLHPFRCQHYIWST